MSVSISQLLEKARVGAHDIEAYAQPLPGGIKFYATYDGKEMASRKISLLLGPFGGMYGRKEIEFKVIEEGKEAHYKVKFSIGMLGTPGAKIFREGKEVKVSEALTETGSVKYCPKCGAKMPDKAMYCPGCGEKIRR